MKTLAAIIVVLLIAGCGKPVQKKQAGKTMYPAFNQSPFPPAPPPKPDQDEYLPVYSRKAPDLPVVIKEEGDFYRDLDKLETVNKLREYAANSPTNNPFALDKESLDTLLKHKTLIIE